MCLPGAALEKLCCTSLDETDSLMPRKRLTTPLVRVDGELVPTSWEVALERVSSGFAEVKDRGEQAFGMFSCSKSTNEMNYAAQRFARKVMGSNNIDSCNRT